MLNEKPKEAAEEEKPEVGPVEAGIVDAAEKAEKDKTFYTILAAKRRKYTQKQIDQASAWIVKKFADLIVFEGKGEKIVPRLFMKHFTVEQRHRDAGLTSLPDGWTVAHSLLAEDFALAYIGPILDETIADKDKLKAIIDLDGKLGFGHAQYFDRWPAMWVDFPKATDA